MARYGFTLFLVLLTVLSLSHLSYAASATSFCKCTCFSNSTIIQLDGLPASSSGDAPATHRDSKQTRGTCNDCNRKFCLSYNLPICKGAKEDDVLTTCFQRDSAKDEAVVFIFIIATTGLLIWAAVQSWVKQYAGSWRERRTAVYEPISNAGADES
ncbi:hypothetical protein EJ06DRAFT_532045 [Trichodelitschia bisporula]|uniref:Uncharacterized protein n=1 Tax=Trichodelitschia bisporula TaxID=703511 RepID=A0A6G1HQG5_9PEZI|nr:hypothetical protein EJ06DRAFT_532045 [Trichodelitschia bisporula]